jgi:hypothetical protein
MEVRVEFAAALNTIGLRVSCTAQGQHRASSAMPLPSGKRRLLSVWCVIVLSSFFLLLLLRALLRTGMVHFGDARLAFMVEQARDADSGLGRPALSPLRRGMRWALAQAS